MRTIFLRLQGCWLELILPDGPRRCPARLSLRLTLKSGVTSTGSHFLSQFLLNRRREQSFPNTILHLGLPSASLYSQQHSFESIASSKSMLPVRRPTALRWNYLIRSSAHSDPFPRCLSIKSRCLETLWKTLG